MTTSNLDTIATIANNRQRSVTPGMRWNAFKRLAEAASDEETRHDLAMLYDSFRVKPKRKQQMSAFDWVAMAAAHKNEVRYYLRYVQVLESGMTIATDGHRMHVTNASTTEPGYYWPEGTAVEDESFKYPDVGRVLRNAITTDTCSLKDAHDGLTIIDTDMGKAKSKNREVVVLYLPGRDKRVLVNRQYLDDMTVGVDPSDVQVGVADSSKDKPVFFNVSKTRTGVIMPVRDSA